MFNVYQCSTIDPPASVVLFIFTVYLTGDLMQFLTGESLSLSCRLQKGSALFCCSLFVILRVAWNTGILSTLS